MENRYGFIKDAIDIKLLILYILRRLPTAVSSADLFETAMLCDGGIGYFEFSDCLTQLAATGHAITEDENLYRITPKGEENGGIMESDLPYSVRVRADRFAASLARSLVRSSLITAEHVMRPAGGYTVSVRMSDGIGPILEIQLACPDEGQTRIIENNFNKNAEKLYGRIVQLLLDEDL